MKTHYLRSFGKILMILLFAAFFQNATALNREVLLEKTLPVKSNFGIADTPRQVSKAKKVVVDRDRDKANIKGKLTLFSAMVEVRGTPPGILVTQ